VIERSTTKSGRSRVVPLLSLALPAVEARSAWREPDDLLFPAPAGVDIKTIASGLGHSSTKLTLDSYGHLMGTDADRAAIDRVNRAFTSQTRPKAGPGIDLGGSL
jgi:integrase